LIEEQLGTSITKIDANEPLALETNDFAVPQEDYPDGVSSHQFNCD
jgi:hypothetical protein